MTGSFANGVSRFSRLFSDQVKDDPDAVTTVPKAGLAMTFAQGSGVSSVALEDDDVLAPAVGEAAEPVRERERRHLGRRERRGARGPGSRRGASASGAGSGVGGAGRSSWCASGPPVAAQDRARHAGEEEALGLGHPVPAQEVRAARPVLPRAPGPVVEEGGELGVHLVEVARPGARSGSPRPR